MQHQIGLLGDGDDCAQMLHALHFQIMMTAKIETTLERTIAIHIEHAFIDELKMLLCLRDI
jgi:hypothetical protein